MAMLNEAVKAEIEEKVLKATIEWCKEAVKDDDPFTVVAKLPGKAVEEYSKILTNLGVF